MLWNRPDRGAGSRRGCEVQWTNRKAAKLHSLLPSALDSALANYHAISQQTASANKMASIGYTTNCRISDQSFFRISYTFPIARTDSQRRSGFSVCTRFAPAIADIRLSMHKPNRSRNAKIPAQLGREGREAAGIEGRPRPAQPVQGDPSGRASPFALD